MFKSSNPVLNEGRFQPSAEDLRPGWGAPGQGGASAGTATVDQMTASQQGQYAQPGYDQHSYAPPGVGSTMTVGGTILATAVLWILLLGAGAYGFSLVKLETMTVRQGLQTVEVTSTQVPGWIWAAALGGFVLALVIAFVPKMARFLAPVYALGYGLALGAISKMYEIQYSGIVLQAVGATVAVFGVMLFLYGSRIIKVTRRFTMVVMGATLGIAVLYLVAFVAQLLGADIYFWREPSALGIGISVFIAVIAALNLALDFSFIENASNQGLPKYMEWFGAFGITVTIVWLYLEMLRLLAMLRE